MPDITHDAPLDGDLFPREVAGLPDALPPGIVRLDDGDVLPLRIGPVRKQVAGRSVRMLAYGGSIPGPLLRVKQGTTVTSVAMGGATMKLVGGDSGRYEREEIVESILLSPSERAVVDVLFDQPGPALLQHRTPHDTSTLATFEVADGAAAASSAGAYHSLRTDPELQAERAALGAHHDRPPDKTLQFLGEMDMSGMDMDSMDVGGMDMDGMGGDAAGEMPQHGVHAETDDGIEWEDTMPEMNVMSNRSNMVWKVVDTETGAVNAEIFWQLQVGDRVKIRLDNSAGSDHQMHHPFHVHGAGRFLVLDRGGVPEPNLAWKDTVLVRAGEVVDILLDATNPGRWMAHCHIAEHIESGMMLSFDVLEPTAAQEGR